MLIFDDFFNEKQNKKLNFNEMQKKEKIKSKNHLTPKWIDVLF